MINDDLAESAAACVLLRAIGERNFEPGWATAYSRGRFGKAQPQTRAPGIAKRTSESRGGGASATKTRADRTPLFTMMLRYLI